MRFPREGELERRLFVAGSTVLWPVVQYMLCGSECLLLCRRRIPSVHCCRALRCSVNRSRRKKGSQRKKGSRRKIPGMERARRKMGGGGGALCREALLPCPHQLMCQAFAKGGGEGRLIPPPSSSIPSSFTSFTFRSPFIFHPSLSLPLFLFSLSLLSPALLQRSEIRKISLKFNAVPSSTFFPLFPSYANE